jgi:hypothetical protein
MSDNNLRDELKKLGYGKDAADELASHIEGHTPVSAAGGCYVECEEGGPEAERQESIMFVRLQKALMELSVVMALLDLLDQHGFIMYEKDGGLERYDVREAVSDARALLEKECST